MKDVSLALRTAYLAKLSGNVTYNGQPVTIYGRRVPVNASIPYIFIANQSSINTSAKTCSKTDQDIDVEVVWRSDTGMEQNILEDLSNQVMEILDVPLVQNGPQPVGFYNIGTRFERATELTDYDGTYTYLRKIITFSNVIYEG